MTDTPSTTPSTRFVPALLGATACALLLGLSFFYPSSTRLYAWPWTGFASAAWLLPLGIAIVRFALDKPFSRFGGLIDVGLLSLAAAAVISAIASPLRGVVLPHLLPVLGACALPYALLPVFHPQSSSRPWRIGGLLAALLVLSSLAFWSPGSRNALPFGHANITGSVFALAAVWLVAGALRETTRLPRVLFAITALAAFIAAYTSQSRGALLGLAAGGALAAGIVLLRRGRLLLFLGILALLGGTLLVSSNRIRELVTHGLSSPLDRGSNDQRLAMILGGLRLGSERPLLGWGAGSVPHAFPRVRADLPGNADNFLQLHNTPVQLWATLGAAGSLAGLILLAGIINRLRTAPPTAVHAVLIAALGTAAVLLLFDHPFATPAFATLVAAAFAACLAPQSSPRHTPRLPVLTVATLTLGLAAAVSARDLAARRAFATALDFAAHNDPAGYADSLRRASDLAPYDPYYPHLLAAQLATGHPFPGAEAASPRTAAALLENTLTLNPDLEYARYNLGWLLLGSAPETAAAHFLASARLAPQRGGVYLGLGLARIQSEDTDGAIRAFAAEWLLNPAAAWSPVWRQPPLAPLLPRIRALATATARARLDGRDPWAALDSTAPIETQPYRRMRTGYGVLMGHPDGPVPVDFNVQIRVKLPREFAATLPPFGWLDGGALLDFLAAD